MLPCVCQPLTILTFVLSSYQVQSDNEAEVGDYVSRVKTWAEAGKTLVASVHRQIHAHTDTAANTHADADLYTHARSQANSHAAQEPVRIYAICKSVGALIRIHTHRHGRA